MCVCVCLMIWFVLFLLFQADVCLWARPHQTPCSFKELNHQCLSFYKPASCPDRKSITVSVSLCVFLLTFPVSSPPAGVLLHPASLFQEQLCRFGELCNGAVASSAPRLDSPVHLDTVLQMDRFWMSVRHHLCPVCYSDGMWRCAFAAWCFEGQRRRFWARTLTLTPYTSRTLLSTSGEICELLSSIKCLL